jgi:lipoprotein-anchoring transpeptidase ErfK/SrfK
MVRPQNPNSFSGCWRRIAAAGLIAIAGGAAPGLRAQENSGAATAGTADAPIAAPEVSSTLDLQVELHRRGFSCGSIDGVFGDQTAAALRAFQGWAGLDETGTLDAPTRARLRLSAPTLGSYAFTSADLAGLHPVPDTWLGKSQAASLGYATALELVAERFHAHPALIRELNPGVDWAAVLPGTKVAVPAAERVEVSGTAARLVIRLEARVLQVADSAGRVIAQFPVSIAQRVDKRPVGDLHLTSVVTDPSYTFDPDMYPESEEGRSLGRMLLIPPGPNNPVGVAWMGLDRPGYGIHGTPEPEHVGRTESHGCFRLANWDALTLVELVQVGMPVSVEP